jgi:membrane dipeptidase
VDVSPSFVPTRTKTSPRWRKTGSPLQTKRSSLLRLWSSATPTTAWWSKRTGSPDVGPGLTDLGKALVRACNELGILIDVSHLNEKGFWDVVNTTTNPIVASHSNANALAPAVRNLTDKQLDAIRDSNGLVGINYHCGFLRSDGASKPAETSLSLIADHLIYVADRNGIDGVALGSDFDGAAMPGDLKDAAGLPRLIDELRSRGFDDESLRKIGYENWLRVFDATWVQ